MVSITKASDSTHKYTATFDDGTTISFGAKGYSDYPSHKDIDRKNNYIKRHQKNEDWNDPKTAGALSRWILWNKTSIEESIRDFKKRFNL